MRTLALLLLLLLGTAAEAAPEYVHKTPGAGGIGKVYQGREIAGVMGWQAAGWLERDNREREERSSLLLERLALRPGLVVADVGAGTGYYTRRFSQAVGPQGRVYAVDVQPEMLALLARLASGPQYANITPLQGAVDDARLPAGAVDLAIMIDVYHELEFPYEVLTSIVRALKPGGRVVFVEYRAEDPGVAIKPLHKMSVVQVMREAAAAGLELEDSIRGLPLQHVLVFRRAGRAPAP